MSTPEGFADCAVKLVLTGYNRPAYITFGVESAAIAPVAVATNIKTQWLATGSMNPRLDQSVTATEFFARTGSASGEDLVGSVTNATPGGASQGSPTPNVAVLAYKRTARGGRRGRGRWFLPWFIDESSLNEDGTIATSAQTSLQTSCDTFRGLLNTNGTQMVVLHRPGITAPGAPTPVESIVIAGVVSTQKRRLVR